MNELFAASGPLYLKIKDLITKRIADGDWGPGTMLPSELKLAEELDVSAGTVRKALNELTAENLLQRRQGKGTFVASHSPHRSLFHFFKMETPDGERAPATSQLLSSTKRRANKNECEKLELTSQSWVLEINRIRTLGGAPCILERIIVPAKLFPNLVEPEVGELPNELYTVYEKRYGITIYRAQEKLRAKAATENQAELLNLEAGAPVLEIDRVALTLKGQPVEWRVSLSDTRHCHYASELV
jgi:GntR family transcriptional regulator